MRRMFVAVVLVGVFVMAALAQDPVKVNPKHYTVLIENDQVRVLRAVLGPGEKSTMHDHPATVVIPLTDAMGRFTTPDGKSEERKMTAGTPLWVPAEKHEPQNTGKNKIEVIIVELKGKK